MNEKHIRECYLALRLSEPTNESIAAIAALRLKLIELVGEERQRELIGEWNEVPNPTGEQSFVLSRLAEDGIAFHFVNRGMPVEWARRLSYLWQYMPPLYRVKDEDTLLQIREMNRQAGEYARARDAGNQEIAMAVLRGSSHDIRESTSNVLSILEQWRLEEESKGEDWGRNYEIEEHEWTLQHADELALWGRSFQRDLEFYMR